MHPSTSYHHIHFVTGVPNRTIIDLHPPRSQSWQLAGISWRDSTACFDDHTMLATDHYAEVFQAFVIFACFFGVLHEMAKKYGKRDGRSGEYISRMSSLVHAVIASILCVLNIASRRRLGDPYGTLTSCQEGIVLMFSTAYFAVDLMGIVANDYFSWLFLIHHLASIAANTYTVWAGKWAHLHTLILFCMEVSGPCMHVHWMNIAKGRHVGHWYNLNRFGYLVVFFVVRGLLGPWLIYESLLIADYPWPLTGLGFAFFFVSMSSLHGVLRKELRGEKWQL